MRSRRSRSGFASLLRLCEQIVAFMEENDSQDCKACIALGNGTPDLYLVTRSEAYDFELGDKLSEFAATYIERGLLGSVTLLPASSPDQLAAFFDLNKVVRVGRMQ
jgi:hypothetical protein